MRDKVRERMREAIRAGLRGGFCQHRLVGLRERVEEKVKLDELWDRLEYADLVKLELEPDEHVTWEDMAGDTFDVDVHEDTVPGGARTIRAQEKRYRERLEQDGVWGVVGYYRVSEDAEWERGDSVWGMELEWAEDNEYRDDIKSQTIEKLRKTLRSRCRCCRRAS